MGDVNWRRAFAISSLIFALLLVCGSVYLHLQQKHHLGRLHHKNKVIVPFAGVDATPDASTVQPNASDNDYNASFLEYYNEEDRSSDESPEDNADFDASNENPQSLRKFSTQAAAAKVPAKQHQVTEACLQCISETTTQCQPSTCHDNEPCGVFRISRPYWIDGGRLRLQGDKSGPRELGPDADYGNCVNNAYCAARTIVNFVNKYGRDCNSDGEIDCRDYISLHVLGPDGCRMSTLSPLFTARMEQCLKKFS